MTSADTAYGVLIDYSYSGVDLGENCCVLAETVTDVNSTKLVLYSGAD